MTDYDLELAFNAGYEDGLNKVAAEYSSEFNTAIQEAQNADDKVLLGLGAGMASAALGTGAAAYLGHLGLRNAAAGTFGLGMAGALGGLGYSMQQGMNSYHARERAGYMDPERHTIEKYRGRRHSGADLATGMILGHALAR